MDPCGTAFKETFQSDNDLFPATFPSRVFQVLSVFIVFTSSYNFLRKLSYKIVSKDLLASR